MQRQTLSTPVPADLRSAESAGLHSDPTPAACSPRTWSDWCSHTHSARDHKNTECYIQCSTSWMIFIFGYDDTFILHKGIMVVAQLNQIQTQWSLSLIWGLNWKKKLLQTLNVLFFLLLILLIKIEMMNGCDPVDLLGNSINSSSLVAAPAGRSSSCLTTDTHTQLWNMCESECV